MEILLKEQQAKIFKGLSEQKAALQVEIDRISQRENELAISILEAHEVPLTPGIQLVDGKFIIPDVKVDRDKYEDAEVVTD